MPEEKITMMGDMLEIESGFSISKELYMEYFKQEKRDVNYDVKIEVPKANQQYYFDIELKHDFLTSEIDFTLFGIDQK